MLISINVRYFTFYAYLVLFIEFLVNMRIKNKLCHYSGRKMSLCACYSMYIFV